MVMSQLGLGKRSSISSGELLFIHLPNIYLQEFNEMMGKPMDAVTQIRLSPDNPAQVLAKEGLNRHFSTIRDV
jgi:hypothetical protein